VGSFGWTTDVGRLVQGMTGSPRRPSGRCREAQRENSRRANNAIFADVIAFSPWVDMRRGLGRLRTAPHSVAQTHESWLGSGNLPREMRLVHSAERFSAQR
jgi:hypothetical protein